MALSPWLSPSPRLRTVLAAPFLLVLLLVPAPGLAETGAQGAAAADGETSRASAAERLHDLFDRAWEFGLRESPLRATGVGRHEYDDRLPSVTPEDIARRLQVTRDFLLELSTIDPGELGPVDAASHAMFETELEERIEGTELGTYRMPINADSGFHTGLPRMHRSMPFRTVEDYESYLSRLGQMPRYFREQMALMEQGLEAGLTVPRVVLEGYEVTIDSHVVEDPEESAFYEPFRELPETIPADRREALREAGRKAVMEGPVVAYREFLEFMTGTYIPGARETLGASEMPRGEEIYAHEVRQYTTLDLTPAEIHQIGLDEVARIRAEMDQVIEEVGFEGSFAEFLEFLRTDPRFYPETPEELLMRAAWIAKRMDGELPALFGRMPRQPYTVEPVPDHLAPKYTAGRYVGSPIGGTEPGIYWVNVHALDSRPFYNLEALTLHEAVPGHHFQTALAQELEGLPEFRRHGYLSAFGEGWGLYSEYLGLEAGFYTDPYSNFGRLTYEMWRACRLVVDTGIHAFGWSRERAQQYMAENTALPLHEVRTEVDRYISWPGQALAYKLGELEIRRLRAEAEERLGDDFDIREFHDTVLGQGSVPLDVLGQIVEGYIRETQAEARAE